MKKTIMRLAALSCMLFTTFSIHAQTWTQQANFPGPARDAAVCFELNDRIYFGGGTNQMDFWEYTPATGIWVQKSNIPNTLQERVASVGFAINGKGYVGMGLDTSNRSDLWQYDPANDQWTQKADFPGGKREGAFCFVIDNKAYIGGGADSNFYITGDMFAYDAASDTWIEKADNPDSAVIYPFCFVINGKGYLSCGQVSVEMNRTFEYDPAMDTWVEKAAFPGAARQAGTSFVMNGQAYCGFGTSNGFNTYYNDFFAYNAAANTWTAMGNMPGSKRAWPSAAVVNNTAYIGTGWSYTTASNSFKDWWAFTAPTAIPYLPGSSQGFTFYPNPVKGLLHLQATGNKLCSYAIYNIAGQRMLSGSFSKEGIADVTKLKAGIYTIEAIADGKTYCNSFTITQ